MTLAELAALLPLIEGAADMVGGLITTLQNEGRQQATPAEAAALANTMAKIAIDRAAFDAAK